VSHRLSFSNLRHMSDAQIRLTKFALLFSDLLLMLIAGFVAALISIAFDGNNCNGWIITQNTERYISWLAIVHLGLAVFLVRFRHYTDRKPYWTELGELLSVVLMLAVVDIAVMAITRWNSSRLWWICVWVISAVALPVGRLFVKRLMCYYHIWQRPTLIIGNGLNAYEALAALRSEWTLGFEVHGFIDIDKSDDTLTNSYLELSGLSWPVFSPASLKDWARVPGVQFVFAMEHGQNEKRENLLRNLIKWHAEDISVIPAMRGIPLFGTDISYFFSHEVALLKLRNNLRYWPARGLKRAFDFITALILLLLLAAPMLWLAWRIRQDGGGAIFAHKRIGRDGKTFNCFKFRTMHMDAERKLRELLEQAPALQEEWIREFKLRNDPRVTDIGQLLRRTSLDELPQLFNVIRGDMSLVGPRPVVQDELCRYGDDVDYFLMVRPGMTGLWQVSGRNDVGYDARVYLDTWYVKNWSLWYDIAILFKTIKVVFQREGAY